MSYKSLRKGRQKRKNSQNDDDQNGLFSHKGNKKSKTQSTSKKSIQTELKKKSTGLRKSNKHSKLELISSSDNFSDSDQCEGGKKKFKVPLQPFKPNKIFAEILQRANKEPAFLIMIKNLLSGWSRVLDDKKAHINKKWNQLRNSNCTQDEYLTRQAELKRMEAEQIKQLEEELISKLSLANIKGFETRQALLDDYKIRNPMESEEEKEYVIDDSTWEKYHDQQLKLLNMLMKQNDFVSSDHHNPISCIIRRPSQPLERNIPSHKQEENELELKFNNLEENPQYTQFLFCKHYNNIHYDKIFDGPAPFKVSEEEKFYIDSKSMAWLLESKSDEIYTNQKFQKQNYAKYSEVLRKMYRNPESMDDHEIINKILQVSAYILNSVHYYQKFKLKCELLHPLDVLLVIQKLNKSLPNRDQLKYKLSQLAMDFENQLKNDFLHGT